MGGRKSPFPITLAIGLYNSLYYRTSRDSSLCLFVHRYHSRSDSVAKIALLSVASVCGCMCVCVCLSTRWLLNRLRCHHKILWEQRVHKSSDVFKMAAFRCTAARMWWFNVSDVLVVNWICSAGGELHGQSDGWARFGAIAYDSNSRKYVFSAPRAYPGHVICQLQQGLFQ